MLTGRAIVFVASIDFRGNNWARQQQLALRLARENRVLYSESQVSWFGPLRPGVERRRWWSWLGKPRAVSPSLHVLSPPPLLPRGHRFRTVHAINSRLVLGSLRRAASRLSFREPIVIVNSPSLMDDFSALRPGLLCYDCHDEPLAFGNHTPFYAEKETSLLRAADLVIVSAESLAETKGRINPNVRLVPNGAEVEHFSRALDPALDIPEEVSRLPRPVAGFVGGIGSWFHIGWLRALAHRNPSLSVVLVGPALTDVSSLKGIPNVHLLGSRPYESLPGYLKAFDVALVPFRMDEVTRNVDPVKLYEYFAAGKPVVATRIPRVERLGDLLYPAGSEEEFLKGVDAALKERDPAKERRRVEFARENSWDVRAAEMGEALLSALEGGGR